MTECTQERKKELVDNVIKKVTTKGMGEVNLLHGTVKEYDNIKKMYNVKWNALVSNGGWLSIT
jgi:hypothetical protein